MTDILILLGELLGVLLFPLGQLGRISFLNQQVSIYPYEAAMGITLVLLVLKYRLKGFTGNPFQKTILLFFVSLIASFVLTVRSYSFYDNTVGFLYFARLVFYIVHFVYLAWHAKHNAHFGKVMFFEIVCLAGVIVATSWLQYLLYPNLRNLLYQGWDPHLYRVFSFFFEPYLAGGALGLSLFFFYFKWHPAGRKRNLKWLLLFVLFVLVMLTFSRTVYAAALITVTVLLLRNNKPYFIAGLAALFVLLALAIPKPVGVGVQLFRTFSIETRLANAKEGIDVWLKAPVFGVGYNRIRYKKAELGLASEFGSSHAAANYHSSFVTMLAAGGFVGFILYLLFLSNLMRISQPSFYYLFFLGIISFGDNALLHPFMMFLFFRLLVLEMINHPSRK